MESWIEQLLPIIEEYRGGAVSFASDENDPLDGDEVDDLCKIIKAKINLHEDDGSLEEVMDMEGEINEEDIPMDIVVAYYEDTYFVEEDFFCNL